MIRQLQYWYYRVMAEKQEGQPSSSGEGRVSRIKKTLGRLLKGRNTSAADVVSANTTYPAAETPSPRTSLIDFFSTDSFKYLLG